MPNLIEGIQAECNRARELLEQYKAIGTAGAFGQFVIENAIEEGEKAIASGDCVQMIRALQDLRECK